VTTLEILRATRAKLEQGWCKGATARDASGAPVPPNAEEAVCWCVFGAAITTGAVWHERQAAYHVLERFTDGAAIDQFQDLATTLDEVLAVIDLGIEAVKEAA
jgi:hypothetical protein